MNDDLTWIAKSYNDNRSLRLMLQLLPYGGLVDKTLSSFYIREKERRLKVFFDELNKGNINLTDEEIQNDEFLHKYFITAKAVVNTRRDEKICYFAHLLQNYNSPMLNPDLDNYDDFLAILDELTFQEIKILLFMRKYFEEYNRPRGLNNVGVYRPLKADLATELNVSENEIISYFIRLERTGLVHLLQNNFQLKEVNDSINLSDTFKKLQALAQM
jgi:hypothetical protein